MRGKASSKGLRHSSLNPRDRKTQLAVHAKGYKFVLILSSHNPDFVNFLSKIHKSQAAYLRRSDPQVAAAWLKEDFLIIKNYFLIGKITPTDTSKI